MWNRKLKQANKFSRASCARETEDDSVDFISQLPDHLLLHIFSFLDETVVFQSSVLSRRWQYLWTLVPFPVHILELRSYFKKQKAVIHERKVCEEEEAENTISELYIHVAKSLVHTFVLGLGFTGFPFREFVVFNPLMTLICMRFFFFSNSPHYSRLRDQEECLKRLQKRDARLTSNANSQSLTKVPMMERLFPDSYEPRYAKSAKVYGSFGIGMLLMIMISCGLIFLRSKFDFSDGIGLSIPILAMLGNLGYVFLS